MRDHPKLSWLPVSTQDQPQPITPWILWDMPRDLNQIVLRSTWSQISNKPNLYPISSPNSTNRQLNSSSSLQCQCRNKYKTLKTNLQVKSSNQRKRRRDLNGWALRKKRKPNSCQRKMHPSKKWSRRRRMIGITWRRLSVAKTVNNWLTKASWLSTKRLIRL